MATTREWNGGHGTKTAGCRRIHGLPETKFREQDWVVFLSDDDDGWIGGEIEEVWRNMYTPHDYVINFTQRLSTQVIPHPNGAVEFRVEWNELQEPGYMTIQETKLEQEVPYTSLAHLFDKQMALIRYDSVHGSI